MSTLLGVVVGAGCSFFVFFSASLTTGIRLLGGASFLLGAFLFSALIGGVLGNLVVGDPLTIFAVLSAARSQGHFTSDVSLKVVDRISNSKSYRKSRGRSSSESVYAARIGWTFGGLFRLAISLVGGIVAGLAKGAWVGLAVFAVALFAAPLLGMVWAVIVYKLVSRVLAEARVR